MTRGPWEPLSRVSEPGERRERERVVAAAVRRRRVELARLKPCSSCGGSPRHDDEDLRCVCERQRAGLQLASRCAELAEQSRAARR